MGGGGVPRELSLLSLLIAPELAKVSGSGGKRFSELALEVDFM